MQPYDDPETVNEMVMKAMPVCTTCNYIKEGFSFDTYPSHYPNCNSQPMIPQPILESFVGGGTGCSITNLMIMLAIFWILLSLL